MYQSKTLLSYDILHGVKFPANLSTLFTYLSYFPPPPPLIPGPPPHRSWTCSSPSYPRLSCFVSDDLNPSSLRQYQPLNNYNQSKLISNTSAIFTDSSYSNKSPSLSNKIINFFQNQYSYVIFSSLLLTIFLCIILILILSVYYQRHKQQQTPTNNKNKNYYYNLLKPRQKSSSQTNNNNEQKLIRLRKHSSPTQVIRLGGITTKNNHETEEAV